MPSPKIENFLQQCAVGNLKTLEKALTQNPVATYGKQLIEGLKIAAMHNQVATIQLLLRIPYVQAHAHLGNNAALMAAHDNGNDAVVTQLLKLKNVRDHLSKSKLPIHRILATISADSNLSLMKKLLEYTKIRATISHEASYVFTTALMNGEIKVVRLLLSLPEVKQRVKDTNEAIIQLITHSPENVIEQALEEPKIMAIAENFQFEGQNLLHYTAMFQPSRLKILLQHNILKQKLSEKDANGKNFLDILLSNPASANYLNTLLDFSEIKELIVAEIDKVMQALTIAVQQKNIDLIKSLVGIPTVREYLHKHDPGFRQEIAAKLVESDLPVLTGIIFNKSTTQRNDEVHKEKDPTLTIIANNDGYFPADPTINFYGEPLFLDGTKTMPIGYNMHIPSSEGNNILVHIYGGGSVDLKEQLGFKPAGLNEFEKYLLNKGTMIVTLNLPDLLEDTPDQSQISESLFFKMHAAIHQFFKTLKIHPEQLSFALSGFDMTNVKIFLYGASFGGLMTIRHAELYPNTFDGYISHDGTLNAEMEKKSSSDLYIQSTWLPHLDPAAPSEITKITNPLLLIHNRDDNNVNFKVLTAFYQALELQDKSHLANICIMQKGSPINNKKFLNKGHFLPIISKDFERYVSFVENFMNRGLSCLPELTSWQAYSQDLLADKHFAEASLQQIFVAEVLERSRFDKDLAYQLSNIDAIWDKKLKPLFLAILIADTLSEGPLSLSFKLEIGRSITNKMIKNVIAANMHILQEYFMEMHRLEFKQEDFLSDDMVAVLKQKIFSLDGTQPKLARFLLQALFIENPILLRLCGNFSEMDEAQHELKLAKKALQKACTQKRKLISHAWQGAAREGLKATSLENFVQHLKEFESHLEGMKPEHFLQLVRSAKKANQYKNATKDIVKLIDNFLEKSNAEKSPQANENKAWLLLVQACITPDPILQSNRKIQALSFLIQAKHGENYSVEDQKNCEKLLDNYLNTLSQATEKGLPRAQKAEPKGFKPSI